MGWSILINDALSWSASGICIADSSLHYGQFTDALLLALAVRHKECFSVLNCGAAPEPYAGGSGIAVD